MMKYTSKYYNLLSFLLRKHLNEQFGREVTKKALKGARYIYKEMLRKCDDIGHDNPMASNIYMCFVFLSIWKAADGAIDYEGYRKVIKNFMSKPPVSIFMRAGDLNNSKTLEKRKVNFHKMQEWADAQHGVLHRDYTLATGGAMCDYWIVPDKIENPR